MQIPTNNIKQYYQSSKYSQKLQLMDFELVFQKIGRFNYNNRVIVIVGTLIIFVIFSLGLINIRMETDPQSLWVSQDSLGYQQQMDFNKNYGAFFRTQQIIFAQDNGREDNVFDHGHLYGMYFLQNLINKKSVTVNQRQININDLCYKPISQKGCYRPSPLDLWKMNITDLYLDDKIQYTALCIESRSQTSRIPCSDESEIPIIKESIYGGISCDQNKDKEYNITIPCDHCWIQAKVLMATYLLNNNEYTLQSAQAWEKQVLIDSIHKYNADNGSFIQEYAKYYPVSEKGEITLENGVTLNMHEYMAGKLNSHFEFMSQRSIPDQLTNQTSQNIWIVAISYSAMFLYIGIAIGRFPSKISSGFTLAIIGIIIVMASVLSSMGVIAYLKIGFTMISGEVIPFLILAIGVDNMFIIKNAIQRQTEFTKLEDRVAHGLKEVGPSITTAAICQSLAFLVGSLTKMPALQNFCIQAAIAIFFNYLFQITTFVVAYIIDEQRKQKKRLDVFCCFSLKKGDEGQPLNFWRRGFAGPYNKLLQKNGCFIATIAISIGLLALAAVGVAKVPVGLNQQVSMQVNSDLFNYFTYQKKYIQIGPPAYIVFNNFDYRNQTQQAYIANLNNEISKLQYIQPPVYSWFASFNNFKMKDQQWTDTCGARNIQEYSYQEQLQKFFAISINSPCCQNYGICGEQYVSDVTFNDQGQLTSSRLRVMHKPLRNSYDYIRAARETRMAVDYVMKPLTNSDPSLDVYPYSLFYVYYDQYSYIRSVAIQNMLLAIAVVFLAVTIIQQIKIALVICGVVLLTTFDLIGFVWITSTLFPDEGFVVQINAISVVNLITCIGLSVEFTAHICISMFKLKGTQQQKLKETLENTGCSVFIGIGLTKFVGVLVLALAKSTLFRLYYFRMYLGIVLLGLFNGLVLLPLLLYKFGPQNRNVIENNKVSLLSKDSLAANFQEPIDRAVTSSKGSYSTADR